MTALKIIAILGIVIGAVSLVVDFKKSGKKNIGVFIALIITSAALLAISFVADGKLGGGPAGQSVAPSVQDDTDVPAVLDLTDPAVPDEPEPTDIKADAAEPVVEPTENKAEVAEPVAEPTGNNADGAPEVAEPSVNAENNEDAVPDNAPAETDLAAQDAPADEPALEVDPLAPIADAGNTVESARVNESLTFSATKSKKKKASLKTFLWDFGDGTTDSGKEVTHAYSAAGTYIATLTVMDKEERFGVATRIVYVNRPENKTRFIHDKQDDVVKAAQSLPVLSGTTTKKFEGSQMVMEATGQVQSSSRCSCDLVVSLSGPGCDTSKNKVTKDNGKGNVSIKVSCKGDPGEYTWKVERNAEGSCGCSWTDFKLDGYEY